MESEEIYRRIFHLFADILEYPGVGLVEAARECEALILPRDPEAASLFHEFRAFAEKKPLARLEEIYSSLFDLDPACHPYVGYHLFGESYKRSLFLLELKERYRVQGFVSESELPDHMAVLLRFLAITDDASQVEEIIREALLPALERMTGRAKSAGYDEGETSAWSDQASLGANSPGVSDPEELAGLQDDLRRSHPYRGVLEALRLVLLKTSLLPPGFLPLPPISAGGRGRNPGGDRCG